MALFSKEQAPSQPSARANAPVMPTSTFIGPNVSIEGTMTGSDPVLIEGSLRGQINLTGDLRIGSRARIEATVHGRNVVVEGKLTGDVSADDKVELVASASVDGNIKAPKIVVAEGARFRGAVDMGRPKDQAEGPAQQHANNRPR